MSAIKEKHIVNKIVSSWGDYFPELNFRKTEFAFRNFRVDIFADFKVEDRERFGLTPNKYTHHAPVFFEVKYNSEMRDLIYELEKQIAFRDYYAKTNCLSVICVISDDFEPTMVKYMKDNNILMYKINIENDDINTLTINEYKTELTIYEDEGDVAI